MNISLLRPVKIGNVSQWFGQHPAWYKPFGLAGHNGIDYAVPAGTPVYAMHAGVVQYRTEQPTGFGIHIKVIGQNYETLYAHLSAISVPDGTTVAAGQQIALSGYTGNCKPAGPDGAHLHAGLKVKGLRNPAYADAIDFTPFRDIN